MCHSPSGAFRDHAPERAAAWALAEATTANDRPAAIPPDSTFCVKRFITDLRMKGDSTALLLFGCHLLRTRGLRERQPGSSAACMPNGLKCRHAGGGERMAHARRPIYRSNPVYERSGVAGCTARRSRRETTGRYRGTA